jgi:DNA repair exonuclease SbcCD nuclease subunit
MSKLSKEYIECRIFILGDEKVGKKSFVQKILNLPCTTIIHDIEAEKQYNKLLEQYKSDIELDKKMQEEQQALLLSINNMSKYQKDNNDITTSRITSTHTLFRIDDDKTLRKTKTNIIQNERTSLNNATTTRNLQGTNNPSSTLIGTISGNHQKKILREPVPEYPAKLYCVDMNKVVIKIFCIPKAEKRPPDFIPRDEDEEYELEKEHNK